MAEAFAWLTADEPPARGSVLAGFQLACWIAVNAPEHLDEFLSDSIAAVAAGASKDLDSELEQLTPGFSGDPDDD